jgi:TonB family protein
MSRTDKLVLYCLVVSLLIHLLTVLFIYGGADLFTRRENAEKQQAPMDVSLVHQSYQIANIERPEKEQRPEKAKFAGLYDSTVEQEQVVASPRPMAGRQGRPGAKGAPGAPGAKNAAPKPKRVKMPSDFDGPVVASRVPDTVQPDTGGGGGGDEGDNQLDGLPGDFFPDYKVGNKTYLNVLRFPKIGYFVRLKKIFYTTWNPRPALMAAGANLISRGQVEVKLAVTIDRNGNLAELFIVNSSGLPGYDHEAVRTIRDSSPFAAPPSELLDENGALRMLWTFTVYM